MLRRFSRIVHNRRSFHALSYRLSEDKTVEPFKPVCVQLGPYEVELDANTRYSWCSCGLSSKQPFCDGKHKGLGIKPVRFTVEEDTVEYLCGCKQTKTPPYCDGTHETCDEVPQHVPPTPAT